MSLRLLNALTTSPKITEITATPPAINKIIFNVPVDFGVVSIVPNEVKDAPLYFTSTTYFSLFVGSYVKVSPLACLTPFTYQITLEKSIPSRLAFSTHTI